MKKLISLLLIFTLLSTAFLFTSCKKKKNDEPKNALLELVSASNNSKSEFAPKKEAPKMPSFGKNLKLKFKANLPFISGLHIDSEFYLSAKSPEDFLVGVKINNLNAASVFDISNTEIYTNLDKVAVAVSEIDPGFAGVSVANIGDLIAKLTGKDLNAAAEATISEIVLMLEEMKTRIFELPENAESQLPASAPELSDAERETIFNIIIEKFTLTKTDATETTDFTASASVNTLLDTTKAVNAELRKNVEWDKFLKDIEKKLSDAIKNMSGEIPYETIDGFLDYIKTYLADSSDVDPDKVVISFLAKTKKNESTNLLYLESIHVEVANDGVIVDALDVKVSFDPIPEVKITLSFGDDNPNDRSKYTFTLDKANAGDSVDKYNLSFTIYESEGGRLTVSSEIYLMLEVGVNDDSFKLGFEMLSDETNESVTVNGTFNTTEDSLTLTVSDVKIESMGVTLNPSLELIISNTDEKTFPEYREFMSIGKAELQAYAKYIGDRLKMAEDYFS